MDILSQNILHCSSTNQILTFQHPNIINENYLYVKLNDILFTLQAQKIQFETKIQSEKNLLHQKLTLQQDKIKELQSKNQKLEQQSKKLRFNYHQRGSVVEYLKKKVSVIQKKFESQKQEMLSVIKYLQSRNSQLSEIIFGLKKKETELNQNISNLQDKYLSLTKEFCFKSFLQSDHLNSSLQKPLQRKSFCLNYSNNDSLTPNPFNIKTKKQGTLCFNREKNIYLNSKTERISLCESSIRQKTIKFENQVNQVKSSVKFHTLQAQKQVNCESKNSSFKDAQLQIRSGQKTLKNNFQNLNLTHHQDQCRTAELKKGNLGSKTKINLLREKKTVEFNTQKRSKDKIF